MSKNIRKRQYLLKEGDVWRYDAFVSSGCLRTYSVDEKGMSILLGLVLRTDSVAIEEASYLENSHDMT